MGAKKKNTRTTGMGLPPPDLISLEDQTVITLLEEEDEDITIFDPYHPSDRTSSHTETIKYPQKGYSSTLRPNANAFTPRTYEVYRSHTPAAAKKHPPNHRIRNSGTEESVLVDFEVVSLPPSPPPTPPTPPYVSPSRSPVISTRSSSPSESIVFRPISPLDLSASPSRTPSSASVRDLAGGRLGDCTTPLSSFSSIASSRIGAREQDVVVTKEEDIDRLFSFAYPTVTTELEEDPLVDITSKEKEIENINESGSTAPDQINNYTKKPKHPQGASLLSVEVIDNIVSQPKSFSFSRDSAVTPPFLKSQPPIKELAIVEKSEKGEKGGKAEQALVDLAGTARDMKSRGSKELYQAIKMASRSASTSKGVNGEGALVDLGTPVGKKRVDAYVESLQDRIGPRIYHSQRQGSPVSRGGSSSGRSSPRGRYSPFNRVGPSGRSTPQKDYRDIYEFYKSISPYRQFTARPSPRLSSPAELKQGSEVDELQKSLMRSWEATEPSESKKKAIARLLDKLTALVNDRFAGPSSQRYPRYIVDVFGSVSWGGETGKSGDLDLVILDHQLKEGYEPSLWKMPPGRRSGSPTSSKERHVARVYNVRQLAMELGKVGMRDIETISQASTPIVKFKDETRTMDCDINVNDLGGWYNSSLILHYCLMSPYVLRPLIHAIKLWAKAFEINDASGAKSAPSFSSYCLTLMVIGYLQHIGHLCNLQAGVKAVYPDNPARKDKDAIWVSWGRDQGTKACIGFERQPPTGWKPRDDHLRAGDALRGFFHFFNKQASDREGRFNFEHQMVSILNGGIVARVDNRGRLQKKQAEKKAELDAMDIDTDTREILWKRWREEQKKETTDVSVGKCDQGVQPVKWADNNIVVQDPFLWEKNCAAAMSRIGFSRFTAAVSWTVEQLSKPETTFEDILKSPLPSIARPKSAGSAGRWNGNCRR